MFVCESFILWVMKNTITYEQAAQIADSHVPKENCENPLTREQKIRAILACCESEEEEEEGPQC